MQGLLQSEGACKQRDYLSKRSLLAKDFHTRKLISRLEASMVLSRFLNRIYALSWKRRDLKISTKCSSKAKQLQVLHLSLGWCYTKIALALLKWKHYLIWQQAMADTIVEPNSRDLFKKLPKNTRKKANSCGKARLNVICWKKKPIISSTWLKCKRNSP